MARGREDPTAIQNRKLEKKPLPDDDEDSPFCEDFPPYASVAFSDKPKSDDVNDIGVLIATIDQEVYEVWNRGD